MKSGIARDSRVLEGNSNNQPESQSHDSSIAKDTQNIYIFASCALFYREERAPLYARHTLRLDDMVRTILMAQDGSRRRRRRRLAPQNPSHIYIYGLMRLLKI